jgi:lysophospholipid acyltransferase (LPLAT)-like uncharacterized protein
MTVESPKPEAANPKRPPRRSGVVTPHAPTWQQRIVARLAFFFLHSLAFTLRFRWDNRSLHLLEELHGPGIYCLWHNRLALSPEVYAHEARHQRLGKGLAALVSASRDGGLLAAILECFHMQPVRGSSSRRGPQALLELTSWAEQGYDLAITPDGPRGPAEVVQDGVMALAQLTGLPIIPFSYHATWKIRLKSWDRFQIPLPFSRCEMRLGPPLRVPRNISDTEREAKKKELEAILHDLSRD